MGGFLTPPSTPSALPFNFAFLSSAAAGTIGLGSTNIQSVVNTATGQYTITTVPLFFIPTEVPITVGNVQTSTFGSFLQVQASSVDSMHRGVITIFTYDFNPGPPAGFVFTNHVFTLWIVGH